MRLIGLAGPKGCGKDTIADYLSRHGYHKKAFAAPIKKALCAMLNIPATVLEDRELKESVHPDLGKTLRNMMQTLGTQWGREHVHPDMWLILMRNELNHQKQFRQNVVVSDVRFENEAKAIRDMGGIIWHIDRTGVMRDDEHASEKGCTFIIGTDYALLNTGTKDELYSSVEVLLGICKYA